MGGKCVFTEQFAHSILVCMARHNRDDSRAGRTTALTGGTNKNEGISIKLRATLFSTREILFIRGSSGILAHRKISKIARQQQNTPFFHKKTRPLLQIHLLNRLIFGCSSSCTYRMQQKLPHRHRWDSQQFFAIVIVNYRATVSAFDYYLHAQTRTPNELRAAWKVKLVSDSQRSVWHTFYSTPSDPITASPTFAHTHTHDIIDIFRILLPLTGVRSISTVSISNGFNAARFEYTNK